MPFTAGFECISQAERRIFGTFHVLEIKLLLKKSNLALRFTRYVTVNNNSN